MTAMPEPGPFDALESLGIDELRLRLQSLQSVIARAPVPIAIAHDPDCHFISANHALAALLGLPEEANFSLTPGPGERPLYRIQQNGRDLEPDELPMQYAIAHRCAVSNEIDIVRADGTILNVQNDVAPLYDTHGRIYGCVSVCVDLTGRKRAEQALRDADRRKDEFLATLSHELRNPLAPVRTAIEVMRLAQGDADVIEKARATIERQLLHLVRLTDDLLDVARITRDKLHLHRERIDLRSVVYQAVEATRPLVDARNHTLMLDVPSEPLWADADPIRMGQAFSNLLNNAVKFTEPGGRIHLTAQSDGNVAVIAVSDNGAGIPAAMLPRVFEMFTQLQQYRDRTQGGLGIGLTLARRLVALHGGTIEAQSAGPGHGSTFTVRVPLAQDVERDAGSAASAQESQDPHVCRVLVAEDNVDAAEMMRVLLEMSGHDVRIARDGLQAVALAKEFDPMIAFLDIGMPHVDGYEAARRIRQALGERVTLVALTGWGQDDDKRRSEEAGFDHHLTKPAEPDVLARLISECREPRRPKSR